MGQHLLFTIRLHDARYHGVAEWPPAPARLFQALVAGAARGSVLPAEMRSGLEWLEALSPPTIAAPRSRRGQRLETYVPNNDADTLGGDLSRIGDIRTKKVVAPRLLEGDDAFVYAWPMAEASAELDHVRSAANELYQFGRGVDMAWATTEVVTDEALEGRLVRHRGTVHHPTSGEGGTSLACPAHGSLASLIRRHVEGQHKLRSDGEGRAARVLFTQPPKPRFVEVAYDAPSSRAIYELRRASEGGGIEAWPVARAVELVERVRDGAAQRLRDSLPDQASAIDRALIGRRPDGTNAAPVAERVRILPLPSIGHEHADRAIRRIVVELPPSCAMPASDVQWAFTGLEPIDPVTGEVAPFLLTPSNDDRMLRHFASPSRLWRTVTPAALPEDAKRRRIEPTRRREDAKGAPERAAEEMRAIAAVRTALRHAGVREPAGHVRVQREPFASKETRADRFAPGTRFVKERLWHVEVTFGQPVKGPLVLGDGRFLGLGVMRPVQVEDGVYALRIEQGLGDAADPAALARALRRAVMARAQAEIGRRSLPTFFSGHDTDGAPVRREESSHLAFHLDGHERLLIFAPHVLDRRSATREEVPHLEVLERALEGMSDLRAGAAGRLTLRQAWIDVEADALLAPARTWISVTPYVVNRHRKAESPSDAVVADILDECVRRGLATPAVTVEHARGVEGYGLTGRVTLTFPVAVRGPMVLGRARYLGGGLFGGRSTEG